MENIGWKRLFALSLVTGTVVLYGCVGEESSGTVACDAPPVPDAVKQVENDAELECYLKTALDRVYGYTADAGPTASPPSDSEPVSTANSGSMEYSGTNLQEAGVDEADWFKSDGQYLYILKAPASTVGTEVTIVADPVLSSETESASVEAAGTTLRVMSLAAGPAAAEVASLELAIPAGSMYLHNRRADGRPPVLVVTSATSGYAHGGLWSRSETDIGIVDVTAPHEPALGARVSIQGRLVSSRRIGETLYVVTQHAAVPDGLLAGTGDAPDPLAEVTLSQLLPDWSYNGDARGDLFDADACYLLPGAPDSHVPQLTAVTAIDLRNPGARPLSTCLVGTADTVYASPESLYLATVSYGDLNAIASTDGGTVSTVATYQGPTTSIHKFSLESTGPKFRGSGRVPGTLGSGTHASFRMSEHEGILRVASSVFEADGSPSTLLTLLEESSGGLSEVAHLPNERRTDPIGQPGESLYAVRFVGDRAFMVTFRMIDPLYVIDLANPADPKILGQLEMPGYSDYLHPVSETLLLGIGKEAVVTTEAGDGRFAWVQGVKLGLFDVSDPAQPREVNSVVLGERGSGSEALFNHHALAWLPASDGRPARLALPVSVHDRDISASTEPWEYFGWTETGLFLFDVGANGIVSRGKIISESYATDQYPSGGGNRALLRGDEVHYVHGSEVWSALWTDPAGAVGPQ